MPGVREGSGGIQNFCRDLIQAVILAYPSTRIHVVIKNDEPSVDDALFSGRVSWASAFSSKVSLRSGVFALRGFAAAREVKPAFIISCHVNFLPAVALVARYAGGVPYAVFMYGIDVWKPLSAGVRIALRGAERIFSISSYTTRLARQAQNLGDKPIHFLPCTFNTERYQLGEKSRTLLARYGLSEDQPIILTISRLDSTERDKGHDEVLQALPAVRAHFPQVRYLIGGRGRYADELARRAVELEVGDLVIFTGFIPNEELCAHYQLCDVFVMPSQKEGFGIVFLEAMACGKPVIAGNKDGSVDALDGGRLGVLVNPNDSREIAGQLVELLSGRSRQELLLKPQELRAAVVATFGKEAFHRRVREALAPLAADSVGAPLAEEADGMRPDRGSKRVAVLTQLTSPYQVEFMNAVSKAGKGSYELLVVYLTSQDKNRLWGLPDIQHKHIILSEQPERKNEAMQWLLEADLTVFNYYTHYFATVAIQRRESTRRPWVFWGERPGSLQLGGLGVCSRRLFLMPLVHALHPIWGVGNYAIEGYQEEFGENRPYVNLPYFSELKHFQEVAHKRKRVAGKLRFLFCGSLSKRKGVDLLARAFLELASQYDRVQLVMAGVGPLADDVKRQLAPVADRVEYLGFIHWKDLPGVYARGDVFCFPSRYDGWGLVLVEAMAAGLPVIGTKWAGAAREFLRDGVNGWLLEELNPAVLLQTMKQAMEADLSTMSAAACQAVERHGLQEGARRFWDAAERAIHPYH